MNQILMFFFLVLLSFQSWALSTPDCKTSDAFSWKVFSESLISLNGRKISNTNPRLRKLEEGVLRNGLITAAYASLYREEKARFGEDQVSQYLWLPAAAFASFEVGQSIRHGYLTVKRKLKVEGTLLPKVYAENPLNEILIVGGLALTGEQVAHNLAVGNHGVYADLYWQHLSSARCGIEKTLLLLGELQRKAPTSKEREHYATHEKGWRLVLNGMETLDRDMFFEGNMNLFYVEQALVLQPLIYDGPLGQLGGTLFAQLAKSPIHDPDFYPNQSFIEYCIDHRKLPNFSRFSTRWAWMTEQLTAMYDFFNGGFAAKVRKEHLFFVSDSQTLLTSN